MPVLIIRTIAYMLMVGGGLLLFSAWGQADVSQAPPWVIQAIAGSAISVWGIAMLLMVKDVLGRKE